MNLLKIKIIIAFLLILFGVNSFSDSIPRFHHEVYRQVIFKNIDKFPKLKLYVLENYPGSPIIEEEKLVNNRKYRISYYNSDSYIVPIGKKLANTLNLDSGDNFTNFYFKYENIIDDNFFYLSDNFVKNSNPLIKEIETYTFHKIKGNKLILYKSEHKQFFKKSSGIKPRITKFDPPKY